MTRRRRQMTRKRRQPRAVPREAAAPLPKEYVALIEELMNNAMQAKIQALEDRPLRSPPRRMTSLGCNRRRCYRCCSSHSQLKKK